MSGGSLTKSSARTCISHQVIYRHFCTEKTASGKLSEQLYFNSKRYENSMQASPIDAPEFDRLA